ncbi:MAG: hypothetical protein ACRDK9_15230 [Solirubrobacterales bacterium]
METATLAVRVDHVNVRVSDPRPLFSLLTERLRLPALWPVTALPGFEIGGVALGNVHIEPTRYGRSPRRRGAGEAELFSICLEPGPIDQVATELTRRDIPHTPPVPYRGEWPAGAETDLFRRVADDRLDPLWTWIFLGGFFGDRALKRQYSSVVFTSRIGAHLARGMGRVSASRILGGAFNSAMAPRRPYPFFCEWNAFDIADARRRAGEELRRHDGGPLGVRGVSEIVVGARDHPGEERRWQELLDPVKPKAERRWELGDGPAIRLVDDTENHIRTLVWEVASLERAMRFLREEGMLGPTDEASVRIAPEVIGGLDIRLAEAF